MPSIVLFEPEIPPNTGNIARTCAATHTPLHLIRPLGFKLSDKYLKRAGLDYWKFVQLTVWPNWQTFCQHLSPKARLVLTSAKAQKLYTDFSFAQHDFIVFGPETRGLPPEIMAQSPHQITIPISNQVRSLNLATSVGIVLYESLRQLKNFPKLA